MFAKTEGSVFCTYRKPGESHGGWSKKLMTATPMCRVLCPMYIRSSSLLAKRTMEIGQNFSHSICQRRIRFEGYGTRTLKEK